MFFEGGHKRTRFGSIQNHDFWAIFQRKTIYSWLAVSFVMITQAQGAWSNCMARWIQHFIKKYIQFALISLQVARGTCGHSNMTLIQNTRPSRPVIGYSRNKWRFWSDHLNLLTLVSLSHWGDLKRAVQNLENLDAICQEELAASPSEKIKYLIHNYRKILQAVTDVEGGKTHY